MAESRTGNQIGPKTNDFGQVAERRREGDYMIEIKDAEVHGRMSSKIRYRVTNLKTKRVALGEAFFDDMDSPREKLDEAILKTIGEMKESEPALPSARDKVFMAINEERNYQDGKWGKDFDDKNTLNDWVTYITMYATDASKMHLSVDEQKRLLLKATTIGVAALEALGRNGEFPKRHYD